MADQRKKRGTSVAAPARPARAARGRGAPSGQGVAPRRTAAAMRTSSRVAVAHTPATKQAAKKAAAARDGVRRKSTSRAGHAAAPVRSVKIKELNAQGKCGPGTSVVHLFRVDEVRDGTPAVHLVFFDRHGWYCEHGRSCHAVDDVRRLAGSHVARTYSVG